MRQFLRSTAVALFVLLSFTWTLNAFTRVPDAPDVCAPPPAGLVSWWPAEGTAEDVAGDNDGTATGATYAAGMVGQAFSFDGDDDYVNISDSPGLDGHSALTLEAWIRPASLGWPNPDPDSDYEAAIITKYDSTQDGRRSYVLALTDGHLKFVVFGTEGRLRAIADDAVSIDAWSHVAGIWDGNTIRLYVNGVEVTATASGSTISQINDNDTAFNIGRVESYSGTFTGPAAFFDGLIDEPSLYDEALSAADIAAIHNAGSDGKCSEITEPTPTPTPSVTGTPTSTSTPTLTPTPLPNNHLPVVMKAPPTPTPTNTPTPAPIIANGDFEQGPMAWTEYSAQGYAIILHESNLLVPAHSGQWATWFGGAYDEASILEQRIAIPGNQYILHYWLWIASEDFCNVDYDIAGVLVDDEAVDAYYLCEPNNTEGWIHRTVDLSAYAGREVLLTFAAFTDSTLNSNMFVDDVSMTAQFHTAPEGPNDNASQLNNEKANHLTKTTIQQAQHTTSEYRRKLIIYLNDQ